MVTQSSGAPGRIRQQGGTSAAIAVALGVVGLVLVVAGASRPSAAPTAAATDTPVLVTARAVSVGAVLTEADVAVVRVASAGSALGSVLHAAGEAIGRRAALALPAGIPVVAALLLDREAPQPGHRVVRLQVEAGTLPPDLQVDQLVDVAAAIPDAQGGGGRLLVVATGRVTVVSGASTVLLDTDVPAAGRLLWAEAFAKSLQILVRPPGDVAPAPLDVTGLAE